MPKNESNVDRIYLTLRQMAADFEFKPESRINEGTLATLLDTSRTPVREALNRLVAEGFLTFQSGRGFFCRSLSPKHILDLYEARVAVECETLRQAATRATKSQIAELRDYLTAIQPEYGKNTPTADLLAMDEQFHCQLAAMSGNAELLRMLKNINDRIRYVRTIDLKQLQDSGTGGKTKKVPTLKAHWQILDALAKRKKKKAVAELRRHIKKRRKAATTAVQIAFSQLYVPDE